MDTNHLFTVLNSIKPMSAGFKTYLAENLVHHHFCSGDHMPYRPPVSRTIYFITYGIVGGIRIAHDQAETLWFSGEGQFVCPGIIPSTVIFVERIEFLTPTHLIGLELTMIIKAIGLFPEAMEILFGLLDQNRLESNDREVFLRLSPGDRFNLIANSIPILFIQAHAHQMATYLNISTRQLMRYKRKYYKRS